MRLKGPSHSFHPPTGVHSSQGSHVYTFTNGAADLDSSSEEEFDIMELRARGVELQRQNALREKISDVVFLERTITEHDSLNKLALQYGCKVADIKRANNFLTEQDMYAVKTIKIPVKVHGIFSEHNEEPSTQNSGSVNSHGIVTEPTEDASVLSTDKGDITQYFLEIDQNIEKAAQNQELFNESFGSGSPRGTPTPRQKDSYLGADWGIRWWNAVLVMLLIGIVLPVFYIIYYERASEKSSPSINGTHSQLNASTHGKEY
ncbi:PREDICTED: lysM and putative peptidoglycan-binding domain-containing protein 4 [Nanorana parkeri]|uniref:lysM and putative peptidoglycan-binding domain-containing protein 4 n=1 Tax=Nanorana parkeri TaxID=125878 RepID=UPI0008546AB2|nr:PREDICTED: lysM and putative peptidoglycan-binding domain-containing protein 4 [Nanorana parkeri]